MTYEELKAEATKHGYCLLKKKPYIEHIKCKCGYRGQMIRHFDVEDMKENYQISCNKCGNRTPYFGSMYDAWSNWYERNRK